MNFEAGSHFKPSMILVPLDFSPASSAALEAASRLAESFKAEIYLLHVVPILFGPDYAAPYYPDQEFFQESMKRAEKKLSESVVTLVARGLKARSGVEVGNDVVGNIMMVVEREHADLIVISTHGVSGWRPMVFGSIAEKVIKLAQCPLLLLRAMKTTSTQESTRGTS